MVERIRERMPVDLLAQLGRMPLMPVRPTAWIAHVVAEQQDRAASRQERKVEHLVAAIASGPQAGGVLAQSIESVVAEEMDFGVVDLAACPGNGAFEPGKGLEVLARLVPIPPIEVGEVDYVGVWRGLIRVVDGDDPAAVFGSCCADSLELLWGEAGASAEEADGPPGPRSLDDAEPVEGPPG